MNKVHGHYVHLTQHWSVITLQPLMQEPVANFSMRSEALTVVAHFLNPILGRQALQSYITGQIQHLMLTPRPCQTPLFAQLYILLCFAMTCL